MKDISDFISTVGFPIVVCLLMIYQQQKMSDSYIEIVENLKELIKDNTNAINFFITRMKKEVGDINANQQEIGATVPVDQQAK